MPTYKVENNSPRDKAIKVYGGSEIVKAGQSASVENAQEFSNEQIDYFASLSVVITLAGKAKPAKTESKLIKG